MRKILDALPSDQYLLSLFHPLGILARLLPCIFRPSCYAAIDHAEFRRLCRWLGPRSLPLIVISAIFISLALTIESVLETTRYGAQDTSGAVISIGLLRELGPLTVSIFWAARVCTLLAYDAKQYVQSKGSRDFVEIFVFPRLIAGLLMAIPLAAYGLVFGFATAAIYSPSLGVSSSEEFLEIARVTIKLKDIICYFVKLIFLNPICAVIVGSAVGLYSEDDGGTTASHAVSVMFIYAVIANLVCTWLMYPLGS